MAAKLGVTPSRLTSIDKRTWGLSRELIEAMTTENNYMLRLLAEFLKRIDRRAIITEARRQ